MVFLVAALLLPSFVHAGSTNAPAGRSTVTLTWDRSPDQTVKGYRLHYGTTSGRNYSRIVDVGKVTTYTISNLNTGKKYYVVVTAYDTCASSRSVVENHVIPPNTETVDRRKVQPTFCRLNRESPCQPCLFPISLINCKMITL